MADPVQTHITWWQAGVAREWEDVKDVVMLNVREARR